MKVKVDYTARLHGSMVVDVPNWMTGQELNAEVEKAAWEQIEQDLYSIGTVGVSTYDTEQEELDYEYDYRYEKGDE